MLKQKFNKAYFDNKGLNIQSIFPVDDLPSDVVENIIDGVSDIEKYSQLILIGHLGTDLWGQLASRMSQVNPVDSFAIDTINKYFNKECKSTVYKIIYPSASPLALQRLGELAGWHYESPFRVGVNNIWGSWFAYRAVVLADTCFETTEKLEASSPCDECASQCCIISCPADALAGDKFTLEKCIEYRKQPESICAYDCKARRACPAGEQYRYSEEQMQYHNGISLKTINEYC